MIVYYFIFYSVYKVLRFLGNKDFPMYGAIGILSMSKFAILGILENLGTIQFYKGSSKLFIIGLVLLIHYLNYLLLIKNIDHEKFDKKIHSMNIFIKRTLFILSLLIVFAPFYFFVKYI